MELDTRGLGAPVAHLRALLRPRAEPFDGMLVTAGVLAAAEQHAEPSLEVARSRAPALMRRLVAACGLVHGANAVNADRIRTALFGGGILESRAQARGLTPDEYFRANLLRREVTADDVANAFAYLATARATTGCVITVDGGNAAAFPR